MKRIVIIGDGAWGTALALVLDRGGHGVTLWSRFPDYAAEMKAKRENVKLVQVRPGHSKPSITLDKHVGFWPTEEDTTAAAIESVLGEPERVLRPSARVVHSATGTGPRRLR